MKGPVVILLMFLSLTCVAQETWYGEIAVYGGGGVNDIVRYKELTGAASFTGQGFYSGGIRIRRMMGDWFSLESGVGFSVQRYTMHSAPMPEVVETTGGFGLVTIPVNARADFLKYFFADAGIITGIQVGDADVDNLSGLGFACGIGASYRFRSDIIITARTFASQQAVVHFLPEEYPHSLFNTGVTLGVGYRFIRLGKCHCPGGNTPGRKFF